MLIKCPECEASVSNRAKSCPQCGCPLIKVEKDSKKKRMRLPNGFGRITKLKTKNLRKPYRAMITVGIDEKGRPIGKILKPTGYFETYNEAYAALLAYKANPYDYDNDISLEEVYTMWYEKKVKKVSKSRVSAINSAWDYISMLHKVKIQTIRQKMIKNSIETCYKMKDGEKVYPSDNMKAVIQTVLSEVMDYAIENEIIEHNYAKDVKLDLDRSKKKEHVEITEEEVRVLKEHVQDGVIVQMMYFQCYTGLRPDEMCKIERCNVNTSGWYIICGLKTAAGKNRKVPIHKNIRSILQKNYELSLKSGCKYLFTRDGKPVLYRYYLDAFEAAMTKYNLTPGHKPHDCRKFFVTFAKKRGMDEYAIKKIIGHAVKDVTESVYTDRGIEWLHEELRKLY